MSDKPRHDGKEGENDRPIVTKIENPDGTKVTFSCGVAASEEDKGLRRVVVPLVVLLFITACLVLGVYVSWKFRPVPPESEPGRSESEEPPWDRFIPKLEKLLPQREKPPAPSAESERKPIGIRLGGEQDPDADLREPSERAMRGKSGGPIGARRSPVDDLEPEELKGKRPKIIPDPSYFLTMGTPLGSCLTHTALSTESPQQMIVCQLERNVLSKDGSRTIMDWGTKIVGKVSGALRTGDERVAFMWKRIETGCAVVDFESLGTDALGRGGFPGHVNTKFWKKLGPGVLLGVIDALGFNFNYSAGGGGGQGGGGGNGVTISTGPAVGQVKSAAQSALEAQKDVTESLENHQAVRLNIVLEQDLDFRPIADLLAGKGCKK